MIERLLLKDFQIHERMEVVFDERITVLVGPSDAGKSAVLRALRWLCFNRPSGDSFIRHGSKDTCVRLLVDGQAVLRRKGGGVNRYRVEGDVYTAFGTGVPAQADDLLQLGPVNFQAQHDPPFWLSLSPGEVSRELNAIVNLGLIDQTLANVASELRKAKAVVEVNKARFEGAKQRRKAIAWVRKANDKLSKVTSIQKRLAVKRERAARLTLLVKEATQALKEKQDVGAAALSLANLCSQAEELIAKRQRLERLETMVDQAKREKEELCRLREQLSTVEKTVNKASKGKCLLCGK